MAGETTKNGYGYPHQQERKKFEPIVKRGEAFCAHPHCGRWIAPEALWDLGHDPLDRTRYLGPMHRKCNRNTTLEKRLRKPTMSRPPAGAWL